MTTSDYREPMYYIRADNGSSHKTIRCFDVLEALQETIRLREQGYEVITHKNFEALEEKVD
jgi:hypothetical protein